jgi:hypothetical protein
MYYNRYLLMSFQRALAGAGQVPDPNRTVRAAGRKKSAVSQKGHGIDATPAKSLKKISTNFTCLASTATFAVAVLARSLDGFTGPEVFKAMGPSISPMAFHISQEGARSRVPQADRAIMAAARKKPAVRREGHGKDATAAKSLSRN